MDGTIFRNAYQSHFWLVKFTSQIIFATLIIIEIRPSFATVIDRPSMSGYIIHGVPNRIYGSPYSAAEDFCQPDTFFSIAETELDFTFQCAKDDGFGELVGIGGYQYAIQGGNCQEGYAPYHIDSGNPESQAVGCIPTGQVIPEKPVEECPSSGNPIIVSSRRKVQMENDYTGPGRYPLVFTRIYTSYPNIDKNAPSRNVWHHNHKKFIRGYFPGGPEPQAPDTYIKLADGSWFPDPVHDNTSTTRSLMAHRPDGSRIYFQFDGYGVAKSDGDITETMETVILEDGSNGVKLTNNEDEIEYYNNVGQLVLTEARNGESHYYNYDSDTGFLLSISDDYGHSLSFEYDESGNIASLTLPDESRIIYSYNQNGDFSSVSYPDGHSGLVSRHYHYEIEDLPRALTGITNENGERYVSWNYDSEGYAVESSNANGINRSSIQLEGDGRITETNALGKDTTYTFSVINGVSRLAAVEGIASTHCAGSNRSMTYDENGFMASSLDQNDNLTYYKHNDRGLQTERTEAVGTSAQRLINTDWHNRFRLPTKFNHPQYQIDFEYDTKGNLNRRIVTDRVENNSRIWSYTYDDHGRIVSEEGPRTDVSDITHFSYHDCQTGGKCGQLKTISNAVGHSTSFTDYDDHGLPTRIVDSNSVVTTLEYDSRQRLTTLKTNGKPTTFSYDKLGNIVRVTLADNTYLDYQWDSASRLVAVTDAAGNRLEYELDLAGNPILENTKDNKGVTKKSLSRQFDELNRLIRLVAAHSGETIFSYDLAGNLRTVTDAQQRITTQNYDALHRLVSIQDALLGDTVVEYDDNNNPLRITDPRGLSTIYTYNGFGDVLTLGNPDTGLTQYTYDSAGNIKQKTDAKGIVSTFQYDALNRVISASYPDSTLNVTYVYDQGNNASGRLSSIIEQNLTTNLEYDQHGNTTAVVYLISDKNFRVEYQYNDANRLSGINYPSGRSINFSFDASGQIVSIDSQFNGATEALVQNIERLPFGPIARYTLGNGIVRSNTFDMDYRIESISDGEILNRGYGFDSTDNITMISNPLVPEGTRGFSYDSLNRLQSASGSYGELEFTYDPSGNRIGEVNFPFGLDNTYQYGNDNHRLLSINQGPEIQYDANGNTLNTDNASFVYNDRNRMQSVTLSGKTVNYYINALGQRVSKTTGDKTTYFIYDLFGKLLMEADDQTGELVEYAYLDQQPLVLWRSDESAPTRPGVATPIKPIDNTNTATPEFVFEQLANATEYRVIIHDKSADERVHDALYLASNICGQGVCTVTPELTLGYSKNHHWRIRARNSVGWGDWTSVIRFNYVDEIPAIATPISPVGSTDNPNPVFTWQDLGNATEYRIVIYDRFLGQRIHDNRYQASEICSEGTCQVSPGLFLNFSKNHYWRVRAINSAGWGKWSDVIRFNYLDELPAVAVPLNPVGEITSRNTEFSWRDVGNAIKYRIIIHDRVLQQRVYDSVYHSTEICQADTCTITPENLSLSIGDNHHWRVRAQNATGWGSWTDPIRFNVNGGQ